LCRPTGAIHYASGPQKKQHDATEPHTPSSAAVYAANTAMPRSTLSNLSVEKGSYLQFTSDRRKFHKKDRAVRDISKSEFPIHIGG
jgi:hypothetical protein